VAMGVDIVLMNQDILKEKWSCQKKYLNSQIMNIDQLKQETDKLKQIDTAQLSPEQLMELIDKLATLIDTGEQHISEIKIEDNEG
jgi:uncharacterized tellurite resistance protein B-like protein